MTLLISETCVQCIDSLQLCIKTVSKLHTNIYPALLVNLKSIYSNTLIYCITVLLSFQFDGRPHAHVIISSVGCSCAWEVLPYKCYNVALVYHLLLHYCFGLDFGKVLKIDSTTLFGSSFQSTYLNSIVDVTVVDRHIISLQLLAETYANFQQTFTLHCFKTCTFNTS